MSEKLCEGPHIFTESGLNRALQIVKNVGLHY